MQCNQPLWCPAFQNNAQFPPYQINSHYTEIIGEGDVIPFILPDGSVQYYFIPVNKSQRRMPFPINSNFPTVLPVWSNPNTEAWFVRSVLNTGTPSPNSTFQYRSYPATFSVDPNAPSYVQKFHYDNWTSTTDLHYFYPRLRSDWLTRGCAAIQVEVPKEERNIYHYGTVCNRPCYCDPNSKNNSERNSNQTCCDEAPMCVDEIKSDSVKQCCCDEHPSSKEKPSRNNTKDNKNNIICGSHFQSKLRTSDKLVTTYSDQGSSCTDFKAYEKKRSRTKKSNTRSSNKDVDACNSACCLGSPCSD